MNNSLGHKNYPIVRHLTMVTIPNNRIEIGPTKEYWVINNLNKNIYNQKKINEL
jgi:hypothetical protein